jgi:hypothetical protein
MNKNKNKNKISKKNFNKALKNISNKYQLHDPKSNGKKYMTEVEYHSTLDNIIEFQKKFTSTEKKNIDTIIYNVSNNDGLFCSYIAWRYLYLENKKQIKIYPSKPASSDNKIDDRLKKMIYELKDRNVIIMDLQFGQANIDAIAKEAKSVIIIDDHAEAKNDVKFPSNVSIFFGDNNHASVAYTWKFFYPKEKVPLLLQYIDSSDRKVYIDTVVYGKLFSSALSFRITNSPFISNSSKSDPDGKLYKKLNNIFENGDPKVWAFIGKYYDEVTENLKTQIANNYCIEKFQGYTVAAMNFNAPGLSHQVGLQLLTNAENRGQKIDFSLIWGWECTPKAYKILLTEANRGNPPKYNLPQMAAKLGKIGGHIRKGMGSKYIGNFYWPRKPGIDIWDLFKKKYI